MIPEFPEDHSNTTVHIFKDALKHCNVGTLPGRLKGEWEGRLSHLKSGAAKNDIIHLARKAGLKKL